MDHVVSHDIPSYRFVSYVIVSYHIRLSVRIWDDSKCPSSLSYLVKMMNQQLFAGSVVCPNWWFKPQFQYWKWQNCKFHTQVWSDKSLMCVECTWTLPCCFIVGHLLCVSKVTRLSVCLCYALVSFPPTHTQNMSVSHTSPAYFT